MSYPDDLDDLVTVVPTNTLDEVPGFLNAASVAIEAIQAENGLNPSGSEATVKARLDAVDATIGGLGGGDLVAANNLSDLASAATSRTNLGLAGAALLAVGTTTGTVAAGDDSRITGAAPATGLYLPGTSGNYVSAPDAAAFDVTDLDIRWYGSLTDWTPASEMVLACRWYTTGSRSWRLAIRTSGAIRLYVSSNGTATANDVQLPIPTVANGAALGIRVTLAVDNGAGAYVATAYTRTDSDVGSSTGWTQLGAAVTGGATTSLWASGNLEISGYAAAAVGALDGTVGALALLDSIGGTVVASYDATAPMGPRYRDPEGNIWTINGSAWAWGELS